MGVMPFLATCHTCELLLLYCMMFLFLFEWLIKFSLSLGKRYDAPAFFLLLPDE